MSKTTNKFSPEVRDRAVRLVLDNEGQHGSRWQAVMSISAKIGCAPQTLNDWVKKAEVDSGKRPGVSSEMAKDTIGIDVSKDRLDAFWHSRTEACCLPNTPEGFGKLCDWLGKEEDVLIVFEATGALSGI